MSFWRHISPRAAVEDFASTWRNPTPHRWRFMALSIAITISILLVFIPPSQFIEPKPPEVTWITTFAEDRTEAEIIASNIANQERQDRLAQEAAEREEARKQLYRELGRASGLDVDAMEAKIAEDEAKAARAAEASATAPSAGAVTTPSTNSATEAAPVTPARAD